MFKRKQKPTEEEITAAKNPDPEPEILVGTLKATIRQWYDEMKPQPMWKYEVCIKEPPECPSLDSWWMLWNHYTKYRMRYVDPPAGVGYAETYDLTAAAACARMQQIREFLASDPKIAKPEILEGECA